MNLDEIRRHRVRRELVKIFGKLYKASVPLVKAEELIELIRSYSKTIEEVFGNIDALRAGIEETQRIISQQIAEIENTMEEPSGRPPPSKGAYLNDPRTPRQRMLGVDVKIVPKHTIPPKPPKIPQRLEFTLTKKKRKPRNLRKLGVIPI